MKDNRILILRHEVCTPAGTTLKWLESRGLPFEVIGTQNIANAPEPKNFCTQPSESFSGMPMDLVYLLKLMN